MTTQEDGAIKGEAETVFVEAAGYWQRDEPWGYTNEGEKKKAG